MTETEQLPIHPMHVISVDQLERDELFHIFEASEQFARIMHDGDNRRRLAQRHMGESVCSLFYEPSTRTRLSFERAAVAIGASVVSTENAREFSSAAKGETIEDTIRVLNEYDFSAIVMRHHETGAAARAAAVSTVPILNAGDGKGEHPTQAILDSYTIFQRFGRLDNLHITLGGDLKRGRTARSLVKLLSQFEGNVFRFVSRKEHRMEPDITDSLDARGIEYEVTTKKKNALLDADVVYWTREQKERTEKSPDDPTHDIESILATMGKGTNAAVAALAGSLLAQLEQVKTNAPDVIDPAYIIEASDLGDIPTGAIIMHPLPRVGEIATEVDADPRAVYFKQAGNGFYTRAVLLNRAIMESS